MCAAANTEVLETRICMRVRTGFCQALPLRVPAERALTYVFLPGRLSVILGPQKHWSVLKVFYLHSASCNTFKCYKCREFQLK